MAILLLSMLLLSGAILALPLSSDPLTHAYFGDLHVHTSFSTDARIFGTVARPDDAYRFAKGEAIEFQNFGKIQLEYGALDFMAVTDHAEYLGVLGMVEDPKKDLGFDIEDTITAFNRIGAAKEAGVPLVEMDRPDLSQSAWQEIADAAEQHNEPGKFTTFIGFEWTTSTQNGAIHRNVIFRGKEVADKPFSMFDSAYPEDLWNWLDELRSQGKEAMAIPHNSNLSGGDMWPNTQSRGEPIDSQWAKQRMRNEVIAEVTQIKGTSETHPLLSGDDQWANFEIYEHRPALIDRVKEFFFTSEPSSEDKARLQGNYARSAYKKGLAYAEQENFNPYKFGMIGSTDSHNAASIFEEENYISKAGKITATPQARLFASNVTFLQRLFQKQVPNLWGSAGLAVVWAEENTRESIYAALRRKETYATTGTRIRVRFFAGYEFGDNLNQQIDMVKKAYALGVPMGGDLRASKHNAAPKFLVWASRDVNSAPLQRIQIIKGWIENGEPREKLFDVVASDGLVPDSITHRIPDNDAEVELSTGRWDETKGAAQLSALWSDPEFKSEQQAFYYVRVLENPKLRWSTHDANTLGVVPLDELPVTIQERAYTSPIWYSPK